MALFDALIADVAGRFGLGSKAAELVREALALIVGREDGVAGFLDLFKHAGLGAAAMAWLGDANAKPLAEGELNKVLGASAIDPVSHRLDIAMPAASTALAYALPKLVGLLTPHGVVPAALPLEAAAFLGPLAGLAAPAGGVFCAVPELRAANHLPDGRCSRFEEE